MKKRIKLNDNIHNKELIKEIEIPAKDHLEAQQKYKAAVFKPKKGKGSFSRKSKYRIKHDD